jgi:iron complex outermembrane receptor protein
MFNYRTSLAVTCVVAEFFLPQLALAQAQTSDNLEEIIVTGTARSEGLRKLDASFSITTATAEQIEQLAPKSTAELLRVVPGLWAEPTGGVSGANIDIRGFPGGGDAPFVTVQLDGSPLFSPPTLSFLENSSLFRLDDTVERVEVLRGGPSPIFANGQPGVTVNFIQKKGTDTPEGIVRGTLGSEGLYRGDVFYGGKLTEGWYFTVGGFYRESEGVRETEFPADRGGQLSGTLTRKFDAGEVTFYARQTRDRNAFFTGTPLLSRNEGRDISEYPGFDPGEDTFYSEELRRYSIETGPGATPVRRARDLADGRNIDLTVAGLTVDLELGGWTLTDRANFVTGAADTHAIFTGANPTTIGAFITSTQAAVNTTPAIVASAGLATSGTATFFRDGSVISDPSLPVIVVGRWSVDKDIDSFTNDLRLSRELFSGNTLTVGAYFADYSTDDSWFLGNNSLVTLQPNARLINVALNNGVAVTREGFTGATTNQVDAHYEATNIAGFLADEWELTDRLRLDVGVRYEEQDVDGRVQNTLPNVDLDANPRTLYNNSAVILAPTARDIDFKADEISWTAGLNFYLTDDISTFARVNSGFKFPQFDNLRSDQRITQTIDQYEVGLKTEMDIVSAYATFFYNDFQGLPFTQFVEQNGTLIQVSAVAGSRAYGVELEATVRPVDNLSIQFLGNWVDAKVQDVLAPTDPLLRSGNQIQRQPRLQFRITPEYEIPLTWGTLGLFVTYTHVGERFSDIQNQQRLPEYDTLDAGIRAEVGDHLTLQFTGTNVTDELGLTEGNARIIGAGNEGGVFLGRTIFGPSYSLSAAYKL